MLMGVLIQHLLLSIYKIIDHFIFSHFLPNHSLTSVFGEKHGITENKPCPLHMCKMHLGCSRDKKPKKQNLFIVLSRSQNSHFHSCS